MNGTTNIPLFPVYVVSHLGRLGTARYALLLFFLVMWSGAHARLGAYFQRVPALHVCAICDTANVKHNGVFASLFGVHDYGSSLRDWTLLVPVLCAGSHILPHDVPNLDLRRSLALTLRRAC